jgi:hypothetical protein
MENIRPTPIRSNAYWRDVMAKVRRDMRYNPQEKGRTCSPCYSTGYVTSKSQPKTHRVKRYGANHRKVRIAAAKSVVSVAQPEAHSVSVPVVKTTDGLVVQCRFRSITEVERYLRATYNIEPGSDAATQIRVSL